MRQGGQRSLTSKWDLLMNDFMTVKSLNYLNDPLHEAKFTTHPNIVMTTTDANETNGAARMLTKITPRLCAESDRLKTQNISLILIIICKIRYLVTIMT